MYVVSNRIFVNSVNKSR